MSKNVAVFVDVANIFYAAKAAGVDIDYVTLLKSATAGRDFVRAYAYTGLDPENENQRQFHAFLARSGYKVVSKDIRKYGDGRIKANLDIELVVDMMRMAEKLDVAVVVSGDGDFAPAISAVQQHGVRVEVISFRGNTSSDLIDVADVFIDIASVAKVEKGARSGRRVAAEGDLSMTEVPDKESGVTPRQRRRDGDDRPERAERPSRRRGSQVAAVASTERVAGSALVALPGEKLSRGGGPAEMPDPGASDHDAAIDEGDEPGSEDGRRRRRRRGGRGRGRGARGPEATEATGVSEVSELAEARPAEPEPETEANEFPDEVPTLPQHSGFGSVWERQIGPPPERRAGTFEGSSQEPSLVDDVESEPDVPEYLLAEKRQHDRRHGGRGGRGGSYRSAIDRERYGVGARPGFQRGPTRAGKGFRTASPGRASAQSMEPIPQSPGGDPWSEVPPEVQELLRAELARRQVGPAKAANGDRSPASEPAQPAEPVEPAAAKPKRATRTRGTAAKSAAEPASAEPVEPAPAKPKRATRTRGTTAKSAAEPASAEPASAEPAQPAEAVEPAAAKPKRTTRARSTGRTAPDEA